MRIECCERGCRYTTGNYNTLSQAITALRHDGGGVRDVQAAGESGGLLVTCPRGHGKTRIDVDSPNA